MGSFAMPVEGGINMNPTGATGTGGITAPNRPVESGFAPPTGSPGNYGYGTSGNPNPTATTSMFPTGGGTPVSGAPKVGVDQAGLGSPTGGYTPDLNSMFGGVGGLLENFLNSSGGYNSGLTQQAVQTQLAEMQRQANFNYGNLESGMGAAGISPMSSTAALESSNFWAGTTAAENAMTAQEYMSMWQTSMANETSILGGMIGPAEHWASQQSGLPGWLNTVLSQFDWAEQTSPKPGQFGGGGGGSMPSGTGGGAGG